jgi:hypothetical protein
MEARSAVGRYDAALTEESSTMASISSERAVRILAGGIALLVITALGACGSEESAPAGSPAPEKSVDDAGRAVVRTEKPGGGVEKAEIRSAGDLPSSFPSDVPTFPGARSTGSMALGDGPALVVFSTNASPADVFNFYREQLAQSGWSIDREAPDQSQITASKGTRTASIRINRSRGATEIGVVLQGG